MRILILGGTGMLGSEIVKYCVSNGIDWFSTVRNKEHLIKVFGASIEDRLFIIKDAKKFEDFEQIIVKTRPNYIINCIGIVKQSSLAYDYVESISINSLLPHKLQEYCHKSDSILIHISTDCVFNGAIGNYSELDPISATDLYGKSKHLGEVGYGCAITLRTSIIGHELNGSGFGLLSWVINQKGVIKGYSNAVFSGFTTLELTKVIFNYVINKDIKTGVYNVASTPISKLELLILINKLYELNLEIMPDNSLKINRSLDASLFKSISNYVAPTWDKMLVDLINCK